jgi:hypothetical protein
MREFSLASLAFPLCLPKGVFILSLSRYDIFVINLVSVVLGYVYGYTPGAGEALARNATSSSYGLTLDVLQPLQDLAWPTSSPAPKILESRWPRRLGTYSDDCCLDGWPTRTSSRANACVCDPSTSLS